MKLHIKIDAQEEEDFPSPFPAGAIERFESVFGMELPVSARVPGVLKQIVNYSEAEVSVSFLGREDMKSVNAQYRGIDEATDVLSFPMWEEGQPEPPASLGILPIGDIVICPDETEREHAPMGRPEALCLVLAHGFLHLLGWDHDTPEKETDMWERQELIKAKLLGEIL